LKSVSVGGTHITRGENHNVCRQPCSDGPSDDQVRELLTLSRDYHDKQLAIHIEAAQVGESLELKWGRITEADIESREALLKRHSELFEADERLFFEYALRGHAVLSDEQIARAEAVYHGEKDRSLAILARSLDNAVAPAFTFRAITEVTSAASAPADSVAV